MSISINMNIINIRISVSNNRNISISIPIHIISPKHPPNPGFSATWIRACRGLRVLCLRLGPLGYEEEGPERVQGLGFKGLRVVGVAARVWVLLNAKPPFVKQPLKPALWTWVCCVPREALQIGTAAKILSAGLRNTKASTVYL